MSQTRENELAYRISEMTKAMNKLIRDAAIAGLKVEIQQIEHNTVGQGHFPHLDIHVWRKL